jgi:hypothetical protein
MMPCGILMSFAISYDQVVINVVETKINNHFCV